MKKQEETIYSVVKELTYQIRNVLQGDVFYRSFKLICFEVARSHLAKKDTICSYRSTKSIFYHLLQPVQSVSI